MKTTKRVAEWVASLADWQALPDAVQTELPYALLDTIGCGFYGKQLEWSACVRQWALAGSRGGTSSLWGDSQPSLRPSEAAFVNGVAAHAFELDDYHPVKVHPGAVVIPAALALGETHRASGARLMAAIAAGYEVMIRTSAALEPTSARLRGWHLTGVTGTLGAAAAAAVILELDAERTAWALGLAGTQSSGLFAFTADGAMSKRFHAGDAARAGVVAAELAATGFSGPTQVFEAIDGGFLNAFADAAKPSELTHELGETWQLLGTAFKPYSCCGSLHAYIDAALELEARHPLGEDTRIRIGLPKVVDVQCGFNYEPGSVLSAQMNARFCVATALRHGAVLPQQFEPTELTDPRTLAIYDRIEQRHDPDLDVIYPAHFCGWVEFEEPAGGPDRAYWHEPSGAASNPDKRKAIGEKFRRLLAAEPVALVDRLEDVIVNVEDYSVLDLIEVMGEHSPLYEPT